MSTLHNATTILDLYFAGAHCQNFNRQDYELRVLGSIFIAAKSSEKDDRVPKSG